MQATWATLAAYYHRLRCGRGDYIDFSRFEAVVQALDPPFGTMGHGALAQGFNTWRGRPRNQDVYPIFACKDGYVRTCVMVFCAVLVASSPGGPGPGSGVAGGADDQVCQETADLAERDRDEAAARAFGAVAAVTDR